jgi:hypothetical protein
MSIESHESALGAGERKFTPITAETINHVLEYRNTFHIALIDQDVDPNPLSNYELLEFIGDLASWKPMTDIFLEYAESHDITMTEQVMTAMHRSFASKDKQSFIARLLSLEAYLKKKGEITTDTYEDMFESIVGAFFFVSFHIRALLGIDLQLHERFLRWVYYNWNFSKYEIKPQITKFHEYMRLFTKESSFHEKKYGSKWVMHYSKETREEIFEYFSEWFGGEPADVRKFTDNLFSLIDKPYDAGTNVYDNRTNKYKDINDYIGKVIDQGCINEMTNERNTVDWDDDVKEEVFKLIDKLENIVVQRYVDKTRSSYYWIVENSEKETIYSTQNRTDSENPSTLLTIIMSETETPESSITYEDYEDDKHDYFILRDNKKIVPIGSQQAIETEVAEIYKGELGKFFIVVRDDGKPIEIEYNVRSGVHIENMSQIEGISALIKKNREDVTTYSAQVTRYIGDRAAYGYTALIATFQHHIVNVHHLTEIRNFYRSKLLKKHLSELLDIRDKDGFLLDFDTVVGTNMNIAELIIMTVYRNILIKPQVIYHPDTRVKDLRAALHAQSQVRCLCHYEKTKKSLIKVSGKRFEYTTSNNLLITAPILGTNSEHVRSIFADYILKREKEINPDHNIIRNHRFVSSPGFDVLRQAMDFRKVSEWQLFKTKRGRMELRYFTEGDKEVEYVFGNSIENINKRL